MKNLIFLLLMPFLLMSQDVKKECARALEAQWAIESWHELATKNVYPVADAFKSSGFMEGYSEEIENANYFKQRYDMTYISEKGLKEILVGYDLVCTMSNKFKDPVPIENQDDVIAFENSYSKLIEEDIQIQLGSRYKDDAPNGIVNWDGGNYYRNHESYTDLIELEQKYFVVCSKQMVDINNLTLTPLERRLNSHHEEIASTPPDPVILFRVKGGFIVITKWLMSHCYTQPRA